jgi:hypothetical protein
LQALRERFSSRIGSSVPPRLSLLMRNGRFANVRIRAYRGALRSHSQ